MVEYFTMLVIEYEMRGHPMTSRIWFETETQCEQALRIDALYSMIYENFEDVAFGCDVSPVVSSETMPGLPKLRPEGFPNAGD